MKKTSNIPYYVTGSCGLYHITYFELYTVWWMTPVVEQLMESCLQQMNELWKRNSSYIRDLDIISIVSVGYLCIHIYRKA